MRTARRVGEQHRVAEERLRQVVHLLREGLPPDAAIRRGVVRHLVRLAPPFVEVVELHLGCEYPIVTLARGI